MSRKLTGAALVGVLSKAAEAAIAGAVERNASQLSASLAGVDAGRDQPSPPLRGRAGEGGAARGDGPLLPPPEGEVGPQGRERVYGLSGWFPKPSPAGLRPSTSPSGGGEGMVTLTLSAPNLFAREFGALDTPADPVLAPAIDAIRRRPA